MSAIGRFFQRLFKRPPAGANGEAAPAAEPACPAATQAPDPIEEKVDAYYREMEPDLGQTTHESRQRIRADLRLQVEYPNQYVCWVDEWVPERGGRKRLVRRVLVHGTDLGDVAVAINEMPPEVAGDYMMLFIRDPEDKSLYDY